MSSNLQQRVTDAAKQSFSLFGYRATSIDRVAQLAGVGKGTIYTFFASKEALLDHILHSYADEMIETIRQSLCGDGTLLDKMERGIAAVLRFRQEQALFVKLSQELQAYGTVEVKVGVQKVEDDVVHYLTGEIENGVANGHIRPCHPELIAFLMYKMMTSLVVDWELHRERLEDSVIAQVFQQVFIEGLE